MVTRWSQRPDTPGPGWLRSARANEPAVADGDASAVLRYASREVALQSARPLWLRFVLDDNGAKSPCPRTSQRSPWSSIVAADRLRAATGDRARANIDPSRD